MLEGLNPVELWKDVWSLLGPFFAIILFTLLPHPEMLEKVVIYLLRAFSRFSERAERRSRASMLTAFFKMGARGLKVKTRIL
jgi:hypothetical protein